MNIVIIKYNAGNTKSVENALLRIGIQPTITDDIEKIIKADKVIFPGVGHAQPTMQYLIERQLDKVIKQLKQPVLGICLGQQLMCAHSEEGNVDGLNIFPVQVKKFCSEDIQYKIPQMGWNSIHLLKTPIFKDISENSFVYFVHSYYCEMSEHTNATCDYLIPFSAALQKDNFYAVQFHPEKSADVGQKILQNFIELI
ncbi:MAG TPA: imidazole glycerol phosphate synthase subunit HisH [Chitinophagales bacterium]|nr:imidazole glycerol phosphate synthase subunit HisH [Chitinophagales bacterium]MBP6155143.1 imidazole glycerol phosphate synthase subunit HisH [Chitinophagales bacterium]HQV79018.1 imidazole glycerol phosphate synthase subunit HisH [Chitinophagales bacterium]HQW79940.1 imidazole glycerol phosphate synthase subunit HisH [Chitinophagales bacterium]